MSRARSSAGRERHKGALQASLRALLAEIIPREVRDPRVAAAGLMTVTRVELAADHRSARVGVSFIGGKGDAEEAVKALARTAGFLRGEVGRQLGARFTPELRFVLDHGGEHAARIDALLKGDE